VNEQLFSEPRAECHLICHSNSPHLSQLFTGLWLLHTTGHIHLSQECRTANYFDNKSQPQHLRKAWQEHVLVVMNHNIRLYYDCHDSHEIDQSAANEADYYFKRSYLSAAIPHSLKAKVFPLGLTYALYSAAIDPFERQRLIAFEGDLISTLHPSRPTLENMSAPFDDDARGILFMTRAWDPFDDPDRSKEKIRERIRVNDMRACCIELLRKRFGPSCQSGFSHTAYAVKHYRSVLLHDKDSAAKENYIKLLSTHAVCVATSGLHGSIGWRMGEYVAFSKAIVSEKLNYEVPGDFKAGMNYLEFSEPQECVEAVDRLLADPALRNRMMRANHHYYHTAVKPNQLVGRTLAIGLSARSDPSKR